MDTISFLTPVGNFTFPSPVGNFTFPSPVGNFTIPPAEIRSLTVRILSNSTQGVAPATFEFEANVAGGAEPYTHNWNFGNGRSEQSDENIVVHTYNEAGTYTVTLTVTDTNDQQATDTLPVIVYEQSPSPGAIPLDAPRITSPADGAKINDNTPTIEGTAEASATVEAFANGISFGTDTADSSTGSWSITPSTPLTDGTYTITATATDASRNSSPQSTGIKVVIDTTAPIVTGTPDRSPDSNGFYNHEVTVTWDGDDGVDGSGFASCDEPTIYPGPDGNSIELSGKCTDNAGNIGFDIFTLNYDATAPTITVPGDMTVEAVDANGATVEYTSPTATDAVDGDVPVICSPESGSTFRIDDTEVQCTATDSADNSVQEAFTVRVHDTQPPQVAAPDDIIVTVTICQGCNNTSTTSTQVLPSDISADPFFDEVRGTYVRIADLGRPRILDNLDTSPTVGNDAPDRFYEGPPTTVSWTATDNSGNSANDEQNVEVRVLDVVG